MSPFRSIFRIALDVPLASCFDFLGPAPSDAMERYVGRRALVPWGRTQAIGIIVGTVAHSEIDAAKLRPVLAILDDLPPLDAHWRALTAFAARYYQRGIGETMLQALPEALRSPARYRLTDSGEWRAPAVVRALKRLRTTLAPAHAGSVIAPKPTPDQASAIEAIGTAFDEQTPKPVLLFGVTGSGKTEVYLRAVAAALARGRQALVLVPEINLTPQLRERFAARFAAHRLHVLHSGLAEGERTLAWTAAALGQADIVLGTRLAIFAPLDRLGIIIVDEEHDASYKQQEGLRYSARDLAVWRANQLGIPIVLGSATPSLETWLNARNGRYRRVDLSTRARSAAALPSVTLVDTTADPAQDGLCATLRQALTETYARGEQSLVFLNRRGFAPVLACSACGWVSACKRCTAHLVLHRAEGRMRCHHCGLELRVPRACPTCGNQDLAPLGRGTQRIEETLSGILPSARISRIDADSTRRKGSAQALFEQVHAGAIDVLVGTQMVAKGHDFERVTLVAVLGADAALFSHDFRAPERLFQQLMQVAGRSGRADTPGRVLVQTRYPTHPLFEALVAHDYARHAELLLEERRSARLPPFTHQAILRAEAKKLELALEWLKSARGLVDVPDVRAYDPVPLTITRLANVERAQLLLESKSRARLQEFLPDFVERLGGRGAGRKGRVKWYVEVDPLDI